MIDYHTERIEDRVQNYDVVIDSLGWLTEELILDSKKSILRKGGDSKSHYIRIASSPHSIDDHEQKGNISKDFLNMAIPEANAFRVMGGFLKQWCSRFSNVSYHFVFVRPNKEVLDELREILALGIIKPVIQEVIPMDDVVRAHRLLEGGHVTGKIVLVIDDTL